VAASWRSLPALKSLQVIEKILVHLAHTNPDHYQPALPLGARAPPQQASLV
jgi:hypothetical protein